jgi:hypothetical protein
MREERCKEVGSIKNTETGKVLITKFAAEAAELLSLGRESCRQAAVIVNCDR